jgi:hypothetical protein
MTSRMRLGTMAMFAAGTLLGWLIASGRFTPIAHTREARTSPNSGTGLSPILPPPVVPFDGMIGRTSCTDRVPELLIRQIP